MNKLFSRILCLLLILSTSVCLFACSNVPAPDSGDTPPTNPVGDPVTDPDNDKEDESGSNNKPSTPESDELVAPESIFLRADGSNWDKTSLKVLAIGNSFTGNAYTYLYDILKAEGAGDLKLCYLYIGGATLKTQFDVICADENKYAFHIFDENGHELRTYSRFSDAIDMEEWDLIFMQQGSSESGVPDSYAYYLPMLINLCQEACSYKDVQFAWHMTWAYQQNATHSAFPNYNNDQSTMYSGILKSVSQHVATNEFIDFSVPAGTAIQNARANIFGDTLTKDGYHLNNLGCYIIGYTWYASLTGETLETLRYVPDDLNLTQKQLDTIVQVVNAAIEKPMEVTLPSSANYTC